MAAADSLTAARLRELLSYDPTTGLFKWRVNRRGGCKAGSVAGVNDGRGYIKTTIDGRPCRAHRLAWLYVYGEWPAHQIDHINGVRSDNRLANLREATNAQNLQNQRKANSKNKCGLLGVGPFGDKWRAQISYYGTTKHLGLFETPELAHAVYLEAKAAMHPFQTLVDVS